MAQIKTETTELPSSRVRVDVEVPAEELQSRLEQSARAIGRELRLPGFRKGKVPPEVVIKRLGREAVLQQTVQDSIDEWCRSALVDASVAHVGEPKIGIDDAPDAGESLSFSIEIGVRPKAELGTYRGLEVGRREAVVPADAIDDEIERLRESVARLDPVERPIEDGDYAVLDFEGKIKGKPFDGGMARDYPVEVGGGSLVEGFESQLVGLSTGDERELKVQFPDDYRESELAGREVVFDVKVKAVQEKHLPNVDDEMAKQVSEFDTLEELRDDIEGKLNEAQERAIADEYREAVVDSAVEAASIELPDELVAERARELISGLSAQLQRQGIGIDQYLKVSGKSEDEMLEELKPRAEKELMRESMLAAVVDVEGVEVSDQEMLEELEPVASHEQVTPGEILKSLKSSGRDKILREDLQARRAVDLLVEQSKPITVEQAKAREKLWTPGKEKPEEASELWTPGKG